MNAAVESERDALADAVAHRDAAHLAKQSAEAVALAAKAEADARRAAFVASGSDEDDDAAQRARSEEDRAARKLERAEHVLTVAQTKVDRLERERDLRDLANARDRASVGTLLAAIKPHLAIVFDCERRIATAVLEIGRACAAQGEAVEDVERLSRSLRVAGLPLRRRSLAWARDLAGVAIGLLRSLEGREIEGVTAGDGWTDAIATAPAHGSPERARFDEILAIVERDLNLTNGRE